MIEVKNLTKIFGEFKALDRLNLKIEENEVFGLVGPNGAGKTTAIDLMMGMLQPTSGSITISGIDVIRNPLEVKKICGYLPEKVGFYEHMTAIENLLYFSEFYKMPKKEAISNINELLELVGIADDADKKVGEFSKGMIQRLGLAQALLNNPKIIFLDEPTSGLDPKGVTDFKNIIKKLRKDGKTVLFSTHILSDVKEACNTLGILSKGKLLLKSSIDDLLKENINIVVETDPLIDPSILKSFGEVKVKDSKVIVKAEEDFRIEISKTIQQRGCTIKEIHLLEPSLEEIYLNLIGGIT
jgi:ABC-2 type transport system ATP-binding protein